MRIGLDARHLDGSNTHGAAGRLVGLYDQLAAVEPSWQVIAYHGGPPWDRGPLFQGRVETRRIKKAADRSFGTWQRWRLGTAAWQDRVDVLHCPVDTCPPWTPVPTVVTVDRLAPVCQDRSGLQARPLERRLRAVCRQAAWLVCPGESIARGLVERFGADPDRVTVLPWTPDPTLRPVPPQFWRSTLNRYGVAGPFVLHFGSGGLADNTRRVIEAWSVCKPIVRRRLQLLVVDLEDPQRRAMRRLVDQLALGASVRLHGQARNEDRSTLFSAAEILAHPSLSDDDGVPILNAWSVGTAVLAGGDDGLSQLVADGALRVDPLDACSIARGLNRLVGDTTLRRVLRTRSSQRLSNHTNTVAARCFARALERAASGRRRRRVA